MALKNTFRRINGYTNKIFKTASTAPLDILFFGSLAELQQILPPGAVTIGAAYGLLASAVCFYI